MGGQEFFLLKHKGRPILFLGKNTKIFQPPPPKTWQDQDEKVHCSRMEWKIAAGCGIWKVYLGPSIKWLPLGNGGVVAIKRQVHQQMTCIIFVSTIQRRKIFCNEFTTFELLVLTLIPKIPKVSTPPPPPFPPSCAGNQSKPSQWAFDLHQCPWVFEPYLAGMGNLKWKCPWVFPAEYKYYIFKYRGD